MRLYCAVGGRAASRVHCGSSAGRAINKDCAAASPARAGQPLLASRAAPALSGRKHSQFGCCSACRTRRRLSWRGPARRRARVSLPGRGYYPTFTCGILNSTAAVRAGLNGFGLTLSHYQMSHSHTSAAAATLHYTPTFISHNLTKVFSFFPSFN